MLCGALIQPEISADELAAEKYQTCDAACRLTEVRVRRLQKLLDRMMLERYNKAGSQ